MFPVVQPAEHKQDVLAEGGKQEAAQERGAIGAEATDKGPDCQEPLCPWCSRQAPAVTEATQEGEPTGQEHWGWS